LPGKRQGKYILSGGKNSAGVVKFRKSGSVKII